MRSCLSFIFLITFCFPVFSAPTQTSIVVQPLHGSTEEEANQKTADILREKLKNYPSLNVIDPKNTEAVLDYYSNYSFSSQMPDAEESKSLLLRAKEHYFQFAYAEGKVELEKVRQIFKNNPDLISSDGEILAESWIISGLTAAAQKNKEEALEDFEAAFRLAPFYSFDAKSFSPTVLKLVNEAKAKLQADANPASIHIDGTPKVADVYLNGIYQGVSSLNLSPLPPGDYLLSFRANNYRTMDRQVSLSPGETVLIRHQLYWEQKTAKQKKSTEIQASRRQIEEGLRVAELLKVDKVLLVDVGDQLITARMVDRKFHAGHQPIVVVIDPQTKELEENLEKLTRFIFAQTQLNLLKNPQAHLDPDGIGDPILLGHRGRTIPRSYLYGGLGAIGVGGILAAVLAGGGSSSPNTGTVAVGFR